MTMGKSLYPKTFLHFTKRIHALESILIDGFFKPSYARERIYGRKGLIRYFGIPMVSFCNIRLSLLSEHTKKYGCYGIGLTQEWAAKNNLNPVLYMSKNSDTFELLDEQLRIIIKGIDKNEQTVETFTKMKNYISLVNILRYMKNHTGPLRRNNKKTVEYCFSDEMEWRYVPSINEKGIIPIALLKNIRDSISKQEYNDKVEHIHLEFGIDDIRYIILKDKNQLNPFIKRLRKREYLINDEFVSKIFFSNHISEDL
ncbi:hypothetical protein I5679_20240 [Citrobacter koseri]|uniref:abortive infection system antitoxin AbiGi family protein n=1 Tax=Citrobacter koseri TaxID=545 RepID=UPI0019018EB6|nr:abortive infection system antitoxin AbiGi family protein [Citrobacter koseri]MBJ9819216.1 hypothetical protein [Citrobacter koseri]